MVETSDYDLVLMDMQMPVMDGVAASLQIRADERFGDLPIVAMTANAMSGDRDRCIQAGMNDHVAKPVDPEALFRTLLEWIPAGDREPVSSSVGGSIASRGRIDSAPDADAVTALAAISGLDVESGLKRVMGKRAFYERLVRGFVEGEEAQAVARIRQFISDDNQETAERAAHSLKGVAGTLGCGELQQRAQLLESAIHADPSGTDVEATLEAVDEELQRILTGIRSALDAQAAGSGPQSTDGDRPGSTAVSDPAGLQSALEGQLARVSQLRETQTINEIEAFAEEIRFLGESHACPPVSAWGAKLGDAAGMFDMDTMSRLLGSFSELSDQVASG